MTKIPLGKNGSRGFAVVDDQDADLVLQYKWVFKQLGSRGQYSYAQMSPKPKTLMHRLIMGTNPDMDIDHANSNGLDNRRQNLRWATRGQNCANSRKRHNTSSEFKGVTWDKNAHKWAVMIRVDGRLRWLGRFVSQREGARAYDTAAREAFGEFAKCNFNHHA